MFTKLYNFLFGVSIKRAVQSAIASKIAQAQSEYDSEVRGLKREKKLAIRELKKAHKCSLNGCADKHVSGILSKIS